MGALLLIDRMVSVYASRSRRRHRLPPPPHSEWPALTSVTYLVDAVDDGPCIHLNNRPLLSLLLSKLPQAQVLKSHLRLIRGSMILDNIRTRFLGGRLIRESDLYASIYGKSKLDKQ